MAGFSMADYRRQQQNTGPSTYTPAPKKPTSDIGNAFWINPYGKILDIGHGKHITSMTQAPEKFGLTLDEIKDAHAKHNEPMGIEGKAREDLIKDAMQRGFIHIRLYPNKFWAVNLWQMNPKAKKALSVWAEEAMKHPSAGKNMQVRIYSLKSDSVVAMTSIQDVYYGMQESIEGFEPQLVESVEDFDTLRHSTFREFLVG
jgi:hypothetical protein